jgi:hypothetical protein
MEPRSDSQLSLSESALKQIRTITFSNEDRRLGSRTLPDRGSGDGGGEPPRIDPIIQGLLSRLPKSGDVWPEADCKLWLQLLEGSFKLIYKDKAADQHARPQHIGRDGINNL